jgi:hypothetical protein
LARVICPFCCNVHDFSAALICPTFSLEVPETYVREYAQVPPLWLMTVGFPQHGKTTYLAALTLTLESMDRVISGLFLRSLGNGHAVIQAMREQAEEGTRPDPTTAAAGEGDAPIQPLLLQVHQMGELGSRCLVLYDVAGESFVSPEAVGRRVPALKQVNTVWFLVSLFDLEQQTEKRTITDLFNVYLSGMEQLRIDVRGWNLIVVYTKSDRATFPPSLVAYLVSDPLTELARTGEPAQNAPLFSIPEYVQEMRAISGALEDYTRSRVRGGPAFVNMVRAKGMNLVFSLTSALGQSPDGDSRYLGHHALPYRILDPFLWALTLERRPPTRGLRLVLCANPGAATGKGPPVAEIWGRLTDHGEVTTHFLGQKRAASVPGQPPPGSATGRSRQRLIGPILHDCGAEERLLVITDGEILDLDDYRQSPWCDRLLLVTVAEEPGSDWPHSIAWRDGDDIEVLIDGLLRL